MHRIKVFFCHAHEDKGITSLIKNSFEEYFGFDGFLAHEDIAPSLEWIPEIIKKLRESDIVILVTSRHSIKSIYANQEIGMSIALNKKLIPIKIENTDPFGFVSNLQACKCKDFTEKGFLEIASEIFFLLVNNPKCKKFSNKSVDSIILALSNSRSYAISRIILKLIIKTEKNFKFSEEQIEDILNVIQKNNQVSDEFYVLPDLKSMLKEKYKVEFGS